MNKKRVRQFLDNNFPPYNECTIIEEKTDKVVALLDYGKREDKLKVTIGYSSDGVMYKLLQTNFVKEV